MLLLNSISPIIVLLLAYSTQARQTRINRYSAALEEDENVSGGFEATVRQVYPTPYPAAGYRPGRAFNLPSEEVDDSTTTTTEGSGLYTTTTEIPTSTTTDGGNLETTTLWGEVPAELMSDNAAKQGRAAKAPYPAAGFRPSKAFLLPTEINVKVSVGDKNDTEVVEAAPTEEAITEEAEVESSTPVPLAPFTPAPAPAVKATPYPPAGYRPSRAFVLPSELQSANWASSVSVNEPEPEPPVSPADKAGHPACGVSDNPQAPKPMEGAADNPDAERVFVTANTGPTVVTARYVPVVLRSQPLLAQPFYIPAGRPFAYSAQVQTW